MKNNDEKFNTNNSDLKMINEEFGSFDLEPPKIYRKDQRRNLTQDNNNQPAQRQRKSKPKNKKSKKHSNSKAKKTNKRKTKKAYRNILYAIIFIVCVAAVFVVLSLTVFFKIDTINISGNEHYTNKEITSVLTIEKGNNLFISDTKKAKSKLEESLPYIYSVDIERKLPSTINITIQETDTIYSIKNKDKTYTLLDSNLKVLEVGATSKPKGSITIKKASLSKSEVGETAVFTDKQCQKDVLVMTKAIKNLVIDEVTEVYSNDINNNYIVYDKRITFKLGTTDDCEDKLYSALAATDKLSESNPQAEGEMTITSDKQIYFTEEK